jgi:prepilin-type N-terminal cleavage/methylation domain-containing protein/prepilin-type processing-associated H-X9-DG protein
MRRKGFTLIELLVVIAIIAILAAILFPVFARAREKARQTSCLSNVKELGLSTLMYIQDYDETYPYWDRFAPADQMPDAPAAAVYPYVKNDQIYVCPSGGIPQDDPRPGWSHYGWATPEYVFPGPASGGYAWNGRICNGDINGGEPMRMARVTMSAETLMLGDGAHMFGGAGGVFVWSNICCDDSWTTAPLDGMGFDPATDSDARHNGGENLGYCDGHAKWNSSTDSLGTIADRMNPRK